MLGKRITTAFLASFTAVALYACYFIAKPFFKPVVFAIAIAIVWVPAFPAAQPRFRRFEACVCTTPVSFAVPSRVPHLSDGAHKTL